MLHLDLSTIQGPSWKPGPVLFTTVFALFGSAAPALWLITVRFGALLAGLMAWRVTARLANPWLGLVAAALVLTLQGFGQSALYGEAEPLTAGCVLFAVDRILADSHRSAVLLLLFATLLRPDVWPLAVVYLAWLVWTRKMSIPLALLAAASPALFWFGGDWWGSGNPLLASTRAHQFVEYHPNQRFAHPGLQILDVMGTILHRPASVLALIAAAVAAVRRDGPVLMIAGFAGVNLVTVAAMAQDGYPVLARFLFTSGALTFVLATICIGYLAETAGRVHVAAAAAVGAGLVAALAPVVVSNARAFVPQARKAEQWSRTVTALPRVIAAAGGRTRVLSCRWVESSVLTTSALAWYLDVHMKRLLMSRYNSDGIVFLQAHAPLTTIEGQKAIRETQIAELDGWRVVYAVTHLPAPTCS